MDLFYIFFIIKHFHYVLSMGAVFALFAGFYYWAPKIIGKTYNDFLGKIHFWTMFVGVIQIIKKIMEHAPKLKILFLSL